MCADAKIMPHVVKEMFADKVLFCEQLDLGPRLFLFLITLSSETFIFSLMVFYIIIKPANTTSSTVLFLTLSDIRSVALN